MKQLVIFTRKPHVTLETLAPTFKEEFRAIHDLYASDFVREVYRRDDGQGAVFVVEAPGVAEVEERLGKLPWVSGGLLEMQVLGLKTFDYSVLFG